MVTCRLGQDTARPLISWAEMTGSVDKAADDENLPCIPLTGKVRFLSLYYWLRSQRHCVHFGWCALVCIEHQCGVSLHKQPTALLICRLFFPVFFFYSSCEPSPCLCYTMNPIPPNTYKQWRAIETANSINLAWVALSRHQTDATNRAKHWDSFPL